MESDLFQPIEISSLKSINSILHFSESISLSHLSLISNLQNSLSREEKVLKTSNLLINDIWKKFNIIMLGFLNDIKKNQEVMRLEIINPLNENKKEFKKKNSMYRTAFSKICEEISSSKINAESIRAQYKISLKEELKTEEEINLVQKEIQKGTIDPFVIEAINNKYCEAKTNSKNCEEQYKEEISKVNKLIYESSKNIKEIIICQENESEKIKDFLLLIIEKLKENFYTMSTYFLQTSEKISQDLKQISSLTQINSVEKQKSFNIDSSELFSKLSFQNIDLKSIELEDDFSSLCIEKLKKPSIKNLSNPSLKVFNPNVAINELNKQHSKDKDFEFLKEIFLKLLNDSQLENFDILCPQILEIFHVSHGRKLLNMIIEQISSNIVLQRQESFEQISIIINYCLNAYLLEKDQENILLYVILKISRFIIYKSKGGKKVNLFSKIKEHQIWQEQERWIPILDDMLKAKITMFKIDYENTKKYNQDKLLRPKVTQGDSNIFSSITSIFTKETQGGLEYETAKKNFIYETLADFSYFLSSTHISKENSLFILFQIGQKYSLVPEKIKDLFKEYSSCQKILIKVNPLKIKKSSFKNEGIIAIFNHSIYFIKRKSVLLSILLLSKSINKVFRIQIYKHLFLRIAEPMKTVDKLKIWEIIIDINSINIENYEILNQNSENNKSQITTFDVILKDVNRSFNNNKEISHTAMINILRSYAYFSKSIEYCQGMNFIVGYLLFLYKNEERVFKFLHILMEKYHMKNVFKQGMTLLMKSFYIFDKLILTFMPDLYEDFRSEGLNSSYFASSWFVTIFSSSLHFSKTADPPILLGVIWDIFLTKGWKGLYLASLFILSELKPRIIGQKFDIIMLYLNDALKGELIRSEAIVIKMKKFILNHTFSGKVIKDLEDEYDLLQKEYDRFQSYMHLK